MDKLPDDVLLEVFKVLTVRDLLALRRQCKRFSELVLHRDVWRSRTAYQRQCRLARLAPCLKSLTLSFEQDLCGRLSYPYRHLLKTTCAVADLRLTLMCYDEPISDCALEPLAMVIERQGSLGRLKKLQLTSYTSMLGVRDVFTMCETVASLSGLEDIALTIGVLKDESRLDSATLTTSVPSSLRRLRFSYSVVVEPLIRLLLTAHAVTLQRVEIADRRRWQCSTTLVELLGRLPNLHELTCPLLPGLDAVLACENLEVLDIKVETGDRPAPVASALELLRRARQLRDVRLACKFDVDSFNIVAIHADMVRALASGPSGVRIEKLMLYWDNGYYGRVRRELLEALPQLEALPPLPALRLLEVVSAQHQYEQVLRGVGPATTPTLQCLEVFDGCPHDWALRARDLMAANTRLHVRVHGKVCGRCIGCKQNGHKAVRNAIYQHYCLLVPAAEPPKCDKKCADCEYVRVIVD